LPINLRTQTDLRIARILKIAKLIFKDFEKSKDGEYEQCRNCNCESNLFAFFIAAYDRF